MITIWLLIEATCSNESMRPSDLTNDNDLKFSRIVVSRFSYDKCWGSNIFNSSTMDVYY